MLRGVVLGGYVGTTHQLPALGVELLDDVAHDDYHGPLLVAGAECPAEGSPGYLPLPARVILPLSLDNSLTFKLPSKLILKKFINFT